jgi:hypothetical protein
LAGRVSTFSLVMTGFGVPLGAQSPYQNVTSSPGTPSSSPVGISDAADQRLLPKTA